MTLERLFISFAQEHFGTNINGVKVFITEEEALIERTLTLFEILHQGLNSRKPFNKHNTLTKNLG